MRSELADGRTTLHIIVRTSPKRRTDAKMGLVQGTAESGDRGT